MGRWSGKWQVACTVPDWLKNEYKSSGQSYHAKSERCMTQISLEWRCHILITAAINPSTKIYKNPVGSLWAWVSGQEKGKLSAQSLRCFQNIRAASLRGERHQILDKTVKLKGWKELQKMMGTYCGHWGQGKVMYILKDLFMMSSPLTVSAGSMIG